MRWVVLVRVVGVHAVRHVRADEEGGPEGSLDHPFFTPRQGGRDAAHGVRHHRRRGTV